MYANQIALAGSFANGVAVVNTAISNLQWGNAASPEIFNILLERSSAGGIAASFTLLALGFIVQMLV